MSLRKDVLVSLLLIVVTSYSVSAQTVELLVNGSFRNGLAGWDVRGTVYVEETGAHLRGLGGITTAISQTIARSDLSSSLVLSYRITTVFPRGEGGPYAKVSVIAYDFKDTAISLYSEKYGKNVDNMNTYSPTVRLDQSDQASYAQPRFQRVVVVFETSFEDIYSRETALDVYVNVVSLKLSTPVSEVATTSVSTTRTTSTTQITTISEVPSRSYDVFIILAAVLAVAVVAVIFLMKRKAKPHTIVPGEISPPEKTPATVEDTKYCTECGRSIPANAHYCGKCGAAQE